MVYLYACNEMVRDAHPMTQTPEQFANKQIYEKTKNRIENLLSADSTRPTVNGSSTTPSLAEIQSIRDFTFRLDGDTPALRQAVENSIQKLKQQYPNYNFNATFGGKK